MQEIKNQITDIIRITTGPEHYFFGYYDLRAWDITDNYHLCNRVKFADRLPEKEDVAELGMVSLNGEFRSIGETSSWNFQQGAVLQWNPGAPGDEVIYNVRHGDEYKCIVKNLRSGAEKILEKPLANVDPTGRYGLSINFDRMFDFRPGYGYAGRTDLFLNDNAPKEDGIFLVDMQNGKSKLIISIEEICEMLNKNNSPVGKGKVLINHINFNTSGTRFVFLARNFPSGGNTWGTAVMTANYDGSELYLLSDHTYASHYHWKDSEDLLIHANNTQGAQLYIFKDKTQEVQVVNADYFLKDGHCSYSPDRQWILYDSYPDSEGYRHLYLYNVAQNKGLTLASLYSPEVITTDIRCDLHPRWNNAGTAISFDSTHENHRYIYTANLADVMRKYFNIC